jgi:hypothetical protein
MAATVLGTAHLYGIEGTVSNATVLKFDVKQSCKNVAVTEDETGREIERRYDDIHYDASLTIRLRTSYSLPAIGSTLTYNSIVYEVVEHTKNTTNKGFRELTLTVKKSEAVAYA